MGEFFSSVQQMMNGVDLTTPSWDVFVLLFFLIGVFMYGIALGRNRLIIILIALYFSFAIFSLSDLIRNVGMFLLRNSDFASLLTFLILFILVFIAVGQSHAARALSHESMGALWQTMVFSILQMGLTMCIAISLLPLSLQSKFSPIIRQIFLEPIGTAVWACLPVLFLILARMKGGTSVR